MNDNTICSMCGQVLTEQNTTEFDGNIMCTDCYETHTTRCDCCGDRIWVSNSEGNECITLCRSCYIDRYTTCEDCGALIHNDYAFYDDDDYAYCQTCYNAKNNDFIRSYGYKPNPIFYGRNLLYMGVEIEIDKGGEISENAEKIINIANEYDNHIYCKHDGSIDNGFELVSHPMTLDYHTNTMNWSEVFDTAVNMGYRSHQTSTCGFHIHVNRSAFGETFEEQEDKVSRIVFIIENYWNELVKFSRRTESTLNRWANRYGIMTTAKDTYNSAKSKHLGRYVAVNLENYNTIEFRMFRGTLNHTTFLATLQLVDELCKLAINFDDKYTESLSWSEFVSSINKDEKPELIEYLKNKRLFVNEVEKNGIAKKALAAYCRLRDRNYCFSGENHITMHVPPLLSEESIVEDFLHSKCEFTNMDTGTFTFILHDAFIEFCILKNLPCHNIVKISELIKKIAGDYVKHDKWRDSNVKSGTQNGYRGIILKK